MKKHLLSLFTVLTLRKVLKTGLALALLLGLFGTYRYVSAQNQRSLRVPSGTVESNVPLISGINHVEVRNYITTGSIGVNLTAGVFSPIDSPQTISCPGLTKCTIQSDSWVDVFEGTVAGNWGAECRFVVLTLA